ncbi:MAG: helix-turn-helix domain-containing protein [Actinomycetota bacterium]
MDESRLPGLLAATEVVGDRWSLPVVAALADGSRRFSDVREVLPGLAPNVLSRRLDDLERAGVVTSTPYQTRPLRKAYELTARGVELLPAARLLSAWGSGDDDLFGTALDPDGWFGPGGDDADDPGDGLVQA